MTIGLVWADTMMALLLARVRAGLCGWVSVSLAWFFDGCGEVVGVVMCIHSGG